MEPLQVSVIIPAYKGAHLIGKTIESVLLQTYPYFELLIIDDASPDNTAEVVQRYNDPRIRYLRHEQNQGANQAWVTGLHAATGDLIACLDQDDLFHPEKLQAHVEVFQQQPAVGFTYNAHFRIQGMSEAIRDLWQPPVRVTLSDLVAGFPFSPSDMIIRRKWVFLDGLWDESYGGRGEEKVINGSEIIYCGLLYLAGCQFAAVPRSLNYRRYHPRRVMSDLDLRCRSELKCQEIIFADPRCPADVRERQAQAYLNTYLVWANYAYAQAEYGLAHEYIRQACKLQPTIVAGNPGRLVESFVYAASAADKTEEPGAIMAQIFGHLPAELADLTRWQNWATARCHLLKGARAVIWGWPDEGRKHFAQASALHATLDDAYLQTLSHQLLLYEGEFGSDAAATVANHLAIHLATVGQGKRVRQLRSRYAIDSAFRDYRAGKLATVPRQVLSAIRNEPKMLANRGVLSILLRSMLKGRLLAPAASTVAL